MSYTEEQKRAHIYTVQKALYEVRRSGQPLPELIPDGIYGPETTEAVRRYQTLRRLPPTGTVDQATWDTLMTEYNEIMGRRERPRHIIPFTSGPIALTVGAVSPGVGMAQIMLWALSAHYDNISAVPLTMTLDGETLEQLNTIQRIANLPERKVLDNATWNALTALFNATAALY